VILLEKGMFRRSLFCFKLINEKSLSLLVTEFYERLGIEAHGYIKRLSTKEPHYQRVNE